MAETRSDLTATTASARAPVGPQPSRSSRRDRRAAGSELAVVVLCVAAIAAHVLDDNFVQPEPATTASDHLISGLIPVLLLAATAAAGTRLRAGGRAVVAMTVGAIGVVVGIPAANDMRNVGMQGDDYTGLLAGVAGVVLLVTGPVVLWRNRRTGGGRRQRYRRRALAIVCTPVLAVALVWFLVFPIGVGYVYTHTAPGPAPPDVGVPHQNVVVTTNDGLELTAAYVPSGNRAAVLLFPGAGRSAEARMLIAHGYGVLLLDPRGQGGSDGDIVRWAGDLDVLAGVAYLRERPEVDADRVGAMGFSIGGEMLLRAAAQSETIRAVVSEGAGESVGETDISGPARFLVDPSQAVMSAATSIFSNHKPPPPIVDHIGAIAPRPVLLIYADPGVGGENTRQPIYYAAAGVPKSMWQVPGSHHTGGLDAAPLDYERRVVGFFDDALLQIDNSLPERITP